MCRNETKKPFKLPLNPGAYLAGFRVARKPPPPSWKEEVWYRNYTHYCPYAPHVLKMKRLSSYEFTSRPEESSISSAEQSADQEPKRPRVGSAPSEESQQRQGQSSVSSNEVPQAEPQVRRDIGTYTVENIRRLTDKGRHWLIKNAFRPLLF